MEKNGNGVVAAVGSDGLVTDDCLLFSCNGKVLPVKEGKGAAGTQRQSHQPQSENGQVPTQEKGKHMHTVAYVLRK